MKAMTYLPSGVSWRLDTDSSFLSVSGAMAISFFRFSSSSFFSAARRPRTSLSFLASSATHFWLALRSLFSSSNSRTFGPLSPDSTMFVFCTTEPSPRETTKRLFARTNVTAVSSRVNRAFDSVSVVLVSARRFLALASYRKTSPSST